MPLLSIRHYETSGNRLAELTWADDEYVHALLPFTPKFNRFDLEDLRWYHEDYRKNWGTASNVVIQRIQHAERKIGEALHEALFHDDTFPLAERVRCAGPDLRIEIRDEVHNAAIPWELIVDPHTGERLALSASSFVRALSGETNRTTGGVTRAACRLLLLISRPDGAADVGYWSIAYELWRELARLPSVKVDVLRPPTFDELVDRLGEAAQGGIPYSAVHFDGHGVIGDPFGGGRTRGYLKFETAGRAGHEFIDGSTLGQVLAGAGVLLFSMNACRSADSEAEDRNLHAAWEPAVGQPSVVEDVLAAGVPSCVGMRREIYPGTAARFFSVFYPQFFGGRSAGEAAGIARNRLHEEPLAATIVREGIAPVTDWSIPVVGESVVLRLHAEAIDEQPEDGPKLERPSFPEDLSAPPLVGFDRAVLELEDALAETSVVLVHGPLLSGKSRLAAEYAKWLSATSPRTSAIHYVRLSESDTPDAVATRMPSWTMLPESSAPAEAVSCAESLKDWNGILILDQADRLAFETQAFLGDVVSGLDGACRVIVTARSGSLAWLPRCRSVVPEVLLGDGRPELGRRWADACGTQFDRAAVHALLSFSGGLPGVILLLLGATHEMISRREASDRDIASWLESDEWDRIVRLGPHPGFGLPSVGALVDEMAAGLSSTCDRAELAAIRTLTRFNVGFDKNSAARLIARVSGTETSAGTASRVIGKLLSSGLVIPDRPAEPTWLLHPLLKLVGARLSGTSCPDGEALEHAFIDTVSQACAELVTRFRSDTARVVDLLELHKQNMADALYLALERRKLLAASHLTEGIGLYCRFTGDVKLLSRVLDHTLPYFIDTRTGALRPLCNDIGLRVWDQAIWISADWPRTRPITLARHGPQRLAPPENDHYSTGLWLRALGQMRNASAAFRAELETPGRNPRYAPGDIECHLSETIFRPGQPQTWPDALQQSHQSYAARLPDDSLGRARSRISEARILMAMVFNRDDYQVGGDDVSTHADLSLDDRATLNESTDLLRKAQSEAGGQSAENRSQAAMLWATIMLQHGDLTSAISYLEEGTQILMALEEISIWGYYWWFARDLVRHGWIARGYEYAQIAFQFAMRAGPILEMRGTTTTIHKFCEDLEAAHPELTGRESSRFRKPSS